MIRSIAILLCCCCTLFHIETKAQWTVVKSIALNAKSMDIDELGNIYFVKNDNSFVKYNELGDSLANYLALSKGNISYVDVTNPMRILLYYDAYSTMQILDRMLAPKSEVDLRKVQLYNCKVIAAGAEGFLWVYDQFNAHLNKLDMDLNFISKGNDLRLQLSYLPIAQYMLEREHQLYMVDSTEGILIFDRYGTYLNTLMIKGITKIQKIGDQIIYFKNDTLHAYNLKSLASNALTLPKIDNQTIISAALYRSQVYVLYQDRFIIYKIDE